MRYTENARRLAECDTYDETFELVKRAAENELGLHRAGLTLVLGDLTNNVGAYHELGSNAIVMNRNLLKIVWRLTKSKKMRNSYVFMILLHEYLHSLGYTDDGQVRELGREITSEFLGEGHIAAQMAVRPLDYFFPEVSRYTAFRDGGTFETVRKFDSSSTPYIA
ncbi:MAG: hypothetical protein HYU03_03900 [Thaumarchaeota archaeon]|nr:hypothetical protein [Nitrososphaerota archaeon]